MVETSDDPNLSRNIPGHEKIPMGYLFISWDIFSNPVPKLNDIMMMNRYPRDIMIPTLAYWKGHVMVVRMPRRPGQSLGPRDPKSLHQTIQ